MRVHARYLLLQTPGWILAALLLYALHRWIGLPLWAAALLMAADLAKDLLLFPYLRRAYESDDEAWVERLVGETAEACENISPTGYVRVRGELWKAQLVDAESVPAGTRLRVHGAQGMLLKVSLAGGPT